MAGYTLSFLTFNWPYTTSESVGRIPKTNEIPSVRF